MRYWNITLTFFQNIFKNFNYTTFGKNISIPYNGKFCSITPAKLLAAMNSLSEQSLVAPYRLDGLAALSVDSAITF